MGSDRLVGVYLDPGRVAGLDQLPGGSGREYPRHAVVRTLLHIDLDLAPRFRSVGGVGKRLSETQILAPKPNPGGQGSGRRGHLSFGRRALPGAAAGRGRRERRHGALQEFTAADAVSRAHADTPFRAASSIPAAKRSISSSVVKTLGETRMQSNSPRTKRGRT